MCLGPEEMSVDQLQDRVDRLRGYLENGNPTESVRKMYEGRLEMFEKLLKEKADSGQMA